MAPLGLRRRIYLALALLALVFLAGTVGYSILESLSLIDALYFTIITITTVGYGDIRPTTPASKLFTIAMIFIGIGAFTILLEAFAEFIAVRSVEEALRGPKVDVEKLSDHYIVCGYGDIGRIVVEELLSSGEKFVVVDKNPDKVRELLDRGIPAIVGDATEEEVLKQAGIDRARGVAALFGSDADNVFLAITAKTLRPDIYVVARANREENIDKLYKVGVDRVISPAIEGGRILARALSNPSLLELLDRITVLRGLDVAQILIPSDSEVEGLTLADSKIEERSGAKVLAIYRAGEVHREPPPQAKLEKDSVILALGSPEQIKQLRQIIGEKRSEKPTSS